MVRPNNFSVAAMALNLSFLFILVLTAPLVTSLPSFLLRTPIKEDHRPYDEKDVGARLIISSYIESGKTEEARNLSKVTGGPIPEDIPSYSGFFTVNSTHDSNLFFWYFPAEHDNENAPLILWLQGGPGASSLYGLFKELGPFFLSEEGDSLEKNPYSWHKNHSIVFIDNPVGTGFSYTNSDSGYATNQEDVGRDLYNALLQFFTMFPELQKNDFFIAGESYAGKYVPAIGHTIHKNKENATVKINLKGLVIGDGLVDPASMLSYSEVGFQWSLLDNTTRIKMQGYEYWASKYLENNVPYMARLMWNDDLQLFRDNAVISVYNIREDSTVGENDYVNILNEKSFRSAIHVGGQDYIFQNNKVYTKLEDDIMKTVRPWVEELLDSGYRVVFYNGQLDVICAYALTLKMVQSLKFNAAEEYRTASRKSWYLDDKIVGYTKTAGNLTEVLVRNAGHMVPHDQPAAAFDLIYRITRNKLHSY